MARWLIILGLLLTTIGLVIAWPLVRAALEFRAVRGEILDVITIPVDAEHLRLFIAYDYPLPTHGEYAIGYTLTDERLQMLSDPVMTVAHANALQRAMKPGRQVRVYYDVNHPLDSAFMLSPINPTGGLRADHGALMVMLGLALGILGQLARLRR